MAAEQKSEPDGPLPTPEGAPAPVKIVKRAAHFLYDQICEHWFMVGLGAAIGIAAAVPDVAKSHGYIRAEWSIKYGAVIIIFLLSGAGLKTKVLMEAASSWRIHLFTQIVSLVVLPVVGFGIGKALLSSGRINRDLASGFIISLCTSTTASTNVVFTKAAGGNEALALVNAVLGNLIGIFLTPAWMVAYLSASTGKIPYGTVISQVVVTILVPLLVGQAFQYKFPEQVKKAQKRVNFGKAGSCMILLLVWSTFSNAFAKKVRADAGSILVIATLNAGVYFVATAGGLLLPLMPGAGRLLRGGGGGRVSEADAVAISMVAGTKTVALGIPIISAVYGSNKRAGLYALPLIIYHAEQILFGNLITAPLQRWVARRRLAADAAAEAEAAAAGGGRARGAGLIDEGGGGQGAGAAGGGAGGEEGSEMRIEVAVTGDQGNMTEGKAGGIAVAQESAPNGHSRRDRQ